MRLNKLTHVSITSDGVFVILLHQIKLNLCMETDNKLVNGKTFSFFKNV